MLFLRMSSINRFRWALGAYRLTIVISMIIKLSTYQNVVSSSVTIPKELTIRYSIFNGYHDSFLFFVCEARSMWWNALCEILGRLLAMKCVSCKNITSIFCQHFSPHHGAFIRPIGALNVKLCQFKSHVVQSG